MKQDQWARLYEEERQHRLSIESEFSWWTKLASDECGKNCDIVLYLLAGGVPLAIRWDDYRFDCYLIS